MRVGHANFLNKPQLYSANAEYTKRAHSLCGTCIGCLYFNTMFMICKDPFKDFFQNHCRNPVLKSHIVQNELYCFVEPLPQYKLSNNLIENPTIL